MNVMADDIRTIYFIGIAGVGMSALARYFLHLGKTVSGYDRDRSELAVQLEAEGASVHYEADVSAIPESIDFVVYTPAIPQDHIELREVRARGIPVYKRAEVLGMLSREKKCIAVAGTHGKTTTAAMIAYALRQCGVNCTALIGGIVKDFNGNFVHGDSEWLVVEADEYDRSFLHLSPDVAVVTSMDPDHLDVYGSKDEMILAYMDFMLRVPENGVLILQSEAVLNNIEAGEHEERREKLLVMFQRIVLTYGDEGMLKVGPVSAGDGLIQFDLDYKLGSGPLQVTMQLPGRYNAMNAASATLVGDVLGKHKEYETSASMECMAGALRSFGGIRRRFEIVFRNADVTIVDDYAHHPAELDAVITAARGFFPDRHITGIFQPHLYSRTRDFHRDFARSLSALDKCILVELYPARELPIEGVSSELIYEFVGTEKELMNKSELISALETVKTDVILFLGAGDLDRMLPEVIEMIENKRN